MRNLCVVVCAAALAQAAFGQVQLVSQSRTLSPSGTPPPASFGPWTGSGSENFSDQGSRGASQTSDLSVTGATFSMSGGGSNGIGLTTLNFVFIAQPGVQFSLTGNTQFLAGPPYPVSGYGTLTFTGPGVNISTPNFGIFTTIPWSYSGVLAGGTYTLHVEATGSGGLQQGTRYYGAGIIQGSLVLTPTPGAAGLLACCGAAIGRKRRRE